MPGKERPTDQDAATARRALLDGLARDADIFQVLSGLAVAAAIRHLQGQPGPGGRGPQGPRRRTMPATYDARRKRATTRSVIGAPQSRPSRRAHTADSVAASDHDRRPYVVCRTPILAQRWHGATRALAAPGCSTGSLSSSASTTTPPLPSRSTPSPPTCCTSWRRVCPCARSGQYSRAGAARPAGPGPGPRLGTSRPGTACPRSGTPPERRDVRTRYPWWGWCRRR